MYSSTHNGIEFIEGNPPSSVQISPISTELNGVFSQSQLKTLDDVKEVMTKIVIAKGGNSVINFKYGQRTNFWKGLIGMDNVHWFATGTIAKLDK